MKKYISYLLASALLVPGIVSCNRLQEEEIPTRTHRVHFMASEAETRTGLSIEGKTVTPDWNKTDVANVHLFETDANAATVYGETLNIALSDDKETAQFEADFPEDMTIAIGAGETPASGGSVARVAPYDYTAVIAQKAAGNDLAFVIPAEQYPDAETLKDPSADFLVGTSIESAAEPHNYDEPVVDLYFTRAAAMGRVAISNFSDNGEKVQSVTIKTAAGLTGSAAYADIDFENGTVAFTRAEGDLTLVYDGAAVPTDGTFYAYFIAIPGEVTIASIEVVTDQFTYTKTVGKASTFSAKSFKNFTLDLSTATKEAVTPSAPAYVKVTSVDELEVGGQYLLVFEGLAGDSDDGDPKVFNPTLNSEGTQFQKKTDYAVDVTISGSTIESADYEDYQFTLEAGYHLLANKAGKYIVPTGSSSGSGTITAESTASTALSITFDNGIVQIKATSGTNYLVWSTSSHYFSSNASVSGQYSTGICLYKLDDGRQSQSFAFTQPTVEYNFDEGGDFPEPTFTVSPIGEVTYSSDNEAVATVNASTGEVTVLKAGTAVISARAAGNNKYRAHTASYTIHSNTSKIQKWVKAEDIEDGVKYLIVSNGEALQNNSGSAAAVAVVENSGVIMYNATDDMIWTAAATSSSGEFTFQNNGQYMQRGGSSNNYVPSFSSSASSYYQWSYNYADSYLTASGNSTYYVYYSTNNSKWSMSTSSGSSHQTVIFKLDDGRTPQTFEFTPSTVEYDFDEGADFPEPTFTVTPVGTLTYSSDNEAVASVNASSGVVTVNKAGTAVITAAAAGNDSYRPHSASYTIHSNTSYVQKWYKAEAIVAGETYLIVSYGYALQNNSGSAAAVAVEDNSGVIQYNATDDMIWAAAATSSSGKFTFQNNGQYMQRGGSSGSYVPSFSSSTSSYYQWSYNYADSYLTASGNSTYYVYYSTNNSKWSMSTSSGSSHQAVLYTTTKPKDARNLQFNPTSVTYDIAVGGTFTAPTLTGAKTDDVTYSSSNTSVASVNASTGAVEIKGVVGTAVITASANETEAYKADQATYTIKVVDGNARYVLASSIEAGKSYIIVSGGYALKNDNGSVASVAVTPENDALEFTPGEEDDLVWTSTAESGFTDNGHFVLSNGGYRMNRVSNSGNFSLSLVATSTAMDKYGVWDLQTYNSDTYLYHDSSSTMRLWVYYDGGWKVTYRSENTSPSSTEKPTQLYVLE